MQAWLSDNVSEDNWLQKRRKEMEAANPRFILRQWVLEEVIAKVEKDPISGRRVLAKILEVRFD
jgi:serine/tyrosine/threonine adenylyltransferase